MKIALVSSPTGSLPITCHGQVERVITYLSNELVKMGHDVTLFGSKNLKTLARVISPTQNSLASGGNIPAYLADMSIALDMVNDMKDEFDIIHFHTDYLHFPLVQNLKVPNVTTLHSRTDQPWFYELCRHFNQIPLITVSEAQKEPLPNGKWLNRVHYGIPENLYRSKSKKRDYLAFYGEISKEDGVDWAIEFAERAEIKLKIAAKSENINLDLYQHKIRPMLEKGKVELVETKTASQVGELLGGAMALIDKGDHMGMGMLAPIEALACGTPVITTINSNTKEIIKDGHNGLVVHENKEVCSALKRLEHISSTDCRKDFEQRFTSRIMAKNYIKEYRKLTLPSSFIGKTYDITQNAFHCYE